MCHDAKVITVSLALLLVCPPLVCPVSSAQLQCSSTKEGKLSLNVTTQRNASGHWVAQMQLEHGEGGNGSPSKPVEIQLEHTTIDCVHDISLLSLNVTEPRTVSPSPGPGYRYFPGFGHYKRHYQMKNFTEANATCHSEGTHLVVVNSPQEAVVLLELSSGYLLSKPHSQWNREAYVGVIDVDREGHFYTVLGEPLSETGYMNWGRNEPNNFLEEDCVTMMRNGQFNDVRCDKEHDFICELE